MNNPLLMLLLGLVYVVIFGGLSLMRREGLSLRFALETVIITLLASALSALAGFDIQPVLFFLFLYLVTMRVRLLSDIGTFLARRGNFRAAERCFALAIQLWPDPAGRLIVLINQATARIQQQRLDEGIALLQQVLSAAAEGYLGLKYESAAYYNLAIAYQKQGKEAQAVKAFNAVLDTWPTSLYAREAERALARRRGKGKESLPADFIDKALD